MSSAHEQLLDDGASAWPELGGGEAVAELIGQRVASARANQWDAAELYLAAHCALGDARAIGSFEKRHFASVRPTLRSMSLDDDDIDEVLQGLRVKLFIADRANETRVIQYAGRGSLGGLVRVAAVRSAISLLRQRRRTVSGDDWLDAMPHGDPNPALAELKRTHRAEFKSAFEEATRSLPHRERSVLRLHLVGRLSIDQVGTMYGVHRATAARWILRAKETLIGGVRDRLARQLRLEKDELGDLLPLIESQLSLSLDRLLQSVHSSA